MAKKQKPSNKQSTTPKKKKLELSGQPAWFTNTRLHCLLIFGFCFVLYANTLTFDYALDDAIVIYDNEFTTQGFGGIEGLLKYDTFRGFFKVEGKDQLVAGGRYRPLTPVLFAIQIALFGESSLIGHLGNVLFYGLTCVLLYLLLLKLFSPEGNTKKADTRAYFLALLASLLFAAHPIHTEVVANIKGLDEIVTLLGSLAALYFSLRAYHEKKIGLNVAAGILFFLALLSKENAITFLAIVPLTYFVFTKANAVTVLRQMIPFVLMSVLFLFIRGDILGWELGQSRELMNNSFLKLVDSYYVDFTAGEKFATIFYSLGKYIQLQIFPYTLTHDYYPRQIEIMSFADWQVLLSVLFHFAIGIFAVLRLFKKDPLSYGILFYLITLSIVSNIFVNVGTNMNERFVFMSSVGFCLVLSILGYRLAEKKGGGKIANFNSLKFIIGIAGLVLLLFSVKTITRNFVWKDNYTLFLTDVKTSTNSAKLRNSAGGELIHQSTCPDDSPYCPKNDAEKNAMLREAVEHLKEAVRIHPGYKNAYLLLGNANNYLQQYEDAIRYYEQALKLDPGYPEATNNLGITYREAGRYYGEQKGDLQKSIQYLTKAVEHRPDEYETVRLLGVAYGVGGNNPKAIEYFTKAVALQPDNASALFDLGSAWFHAGDQAKANEYFAKAKEINPNIENERGGGR